MKIQIDIPEQEIVEFCKKWKIVEFALFGSVLRDDFRPDSDIDVLIRFAPTSPRSFFEMARMQWDLEAIFGRKVDLLSRGGVELEDNVLRKSAILDSARILYAA